VEDPVIFALDANIWISERLLRSATGAAFLHSVRRLDAKILLPEATRNEVVVGVERAGLEAVGMVQRGFATIQSLTGSRQDCRVPCGDDFRLAAVDRLDEMDDLILPCALSMEHYSRALARVDEHRPPAETREQYRDCLLWEAVLDNSAGECVLVSADKDFLDKASGKGTLARALSEESKGNVTLFPTLADALRAIEPQVPPLDLAAIADAIADEVMPVAIEYARKGEGFRLGERIAADIELYATEEPGATAAVFSIGFEAFDLHVYGGTLVDEAVVSFGGECMLRAGNEVTDFAMDHIHLVALDGERLPGGVVYARGSLTLGVRQLPYRVRVRVPGAPT
jgi:hypothetical protein